MVGEFKSGFMFHSISWLSHKSRRPTKSTPDAEIISAPEAIDEAKKIAYTYKQLLGIDVQICVGYKDLFTSLLTQRNSIDRSIRIDVAYIRFEFQVCSVDKVTWIPGKQTWQRYFPSQKALSPNH